MKYILYFTLRASFAIQNRSVRFCGYLEQDKFEQRSETTLALAEYKDVFCKSNSLSSETTG
ncbi:MAG: hypothetical protein OQJ95_01110 [Kangiella sp.]|nr:hypothetical protein [Kangiella sp.]